MKPIIVADIGGTNARFGLGTAVNVDTGQVTLEHKRQYPSAEFPDFSSALGCYYDSLGGLRPMRACMAIAGPVKDGRVRMTNLNWSVSKSKACRLFGLEYFEVINDYTAMVYSTLFLGPDALSTICDGTIIPSAPRCIVGPGTGLGVAAIVPSNGRWVTLSGEGGHITLASTGKYENMVIQQIAPLQGMVSAETVLSGPGILRVYQAICTIEGYHGTAKSPAEVTAAALSESDPAAISAVAMFCRLLGGMVGDMVLTFGAQGGAFLAGGILPRIESILTDSEFEHCLKNKGVMSHYLENVNVAMITADDAALVGAAAWACSKPENESRSVA